MEFFGDLASFAIKSLLILIVIVAVVTLITLIISSAVRRSRPHPLGKIQVTCLNDHYREIKETIEAFTLSKKARKKRDVERKKTAKKQDDDDRPKLWLLEFSGDIAATQVSELREQVTATLAAADPTRDEVVVLLDSPGGVMHTYGLGASQLVRIRDKGLPLTVCVDKTAASGGYMMAAVADRIIAAPFAILGSIGVLAMVPNFHRILEKYGVDYMELTAGKYKRTLSYLGEITDEGLAHFRQELEDSHDLFKRFIGRYRPSLELEKIATGEHWFGEDAAELALVDELRTSDDYLVERAEIYDIFRIDFEVSKTVKEKFAGVISEAGDRLILRWLNRLGRSSRLHARD